MYRAGPSTPHRLVLTLGLIQLVCWGISFYLPAVLGPAMAAELAVSSNQIYAGSSVALLVMGIVSLPIGRLIDQHGGRRIMTSGVLLLAFGLLCLSGCRNLYQYYGCWALLGLAMRMTLYEAAFATVVRMSGIATSTAIARITLIGGLASTVFWPLGHALLSWLGWRHTVVVYALLAICLLPLFSRMSDNQRNAESTTETNTRAMKLSWNAVLFAVMTMLSAFLSNGMSIYMIIILSGLGVSPELAVWLAALRGVSQTAARLLSEFAGTAANPLQSALLATGGLTAGFMLVCYISISTWALMAWVITFGMAIGLLTIVRGTLPLLLFDVSGYGRISGGLLAPGFILAALAPLLFGLISSHSGIAVLLKWSLLLSVACLLCALGLWQWHTGPGED
ncbi:MFS transporter [Gynuella sunshinyii]|uniref:Arabinose efflux permease n=1 Tax=Gynuella sunshinyii YC6258 TaxID=1445510 RepID=A0A0C5VG91_9GAMM|nr:MFS transporter [Gynuella sunshinyii]AJQ92433.1 arabinose efflux permease [Gynuella sunshinyii YC6258]